MLCHQNPLRGMTAKESRENLKATPPTEVRHLYLVFFYDDVETFFDLILPLLGDYRKWQLPEKKLHHDPNSYAPPDAPFEGEPTYKSDYHLHPFSMRQSLRPEEGGRGNTDPFDGRTGYRDDYIKHPMERRQPKEKQEHKGPGAPLDG